MITVLDTLSAWVINGAFIEISSSVLLSLGGAGQFEDDHFKKGISGIDPLLEDELEKFFALLFLVFVLEDDF